jgi:hypothetical protein
MGHNALLGSNVIGIDSMEIETLQKGKGNMGG